MCLSQGVFELFGIEDITAVSFDQNIILAVALCFSSQSRGSPFGVGVSLNKQLMSDTS